MLLDSPWLVQVLLALSVLTLGSGSEPQNAPRVFLSFKGSGVATPAQLTFLVKLFHPTWRVNQKHLNCPLSLATSFPLVLNFITAISPRCQRSVLSCKIRSFEIKSVESDLFSRPLSIRFYRRNTGRIVFERVMIIQTWHCDHMRISRGELIRMNRQMDDKGERAICIPTNLCSNLCSCTIMQPVCISSEHKQQQLDLKKNPHKPEHALRALRVRSADYHALSHQFQVSQFSMSVWREGEAFECCDMMTLNQRLEIS
ncbi:hypothetical protein QQF64_004002 [Cirrhinus molitorella]|uniref:Uncharacterized protein n=1 Tax=Cirrhinus molitorella TaxID=172907 RepID=A0ABR3MN11_9TELE